MRIIKSIMVIGAVSVALALSACVHGGVQGSSGSGAALNLQGGISLPLGK